MLIMTQYYISLPQNVLCSVCDTELVSSRKELEVSKSTAAMDRGRWFNRQWLIHWHHSLIVD